MKYGLFSSSFFAFFLLFSSIVYAQIPTSLGGLDLSLSSENPVPGQTVTITARSYTIDINSAKINWLVNNSSVKSGIGATVLEVKAPALGKTLSVKVSATTPEGKIETGTIVVGSGSVDMIFETDGYVPPFFRGKISPVYQNAVKIIAIPHLANSSGVEYDPKTLIYQWQKNDRAIENQSGYGKQSITLVGDLVPRAYDLRVDVWSRDNVAHGQGLVEVAVSEPVITFYVDDPSYGTLFNRAIDSIVRIGSQKETAILAVPFGFNESASENGSLEWSWLINSAAHNELSSSKSIVLRAPDNSAGSSNVRLDIRNTDKILQGASGGFSASFSNEKSADTEQVTF